MKHACIKWCLVSCSNIYLDMMDVDLHTALLHRWQCFPMRQYLRLHTCSVTFTFFVLDTALLLAMNLNRENDSEESGLTF